MESDKESSSNVSTRPKMRQSSGAELLRRTSTLSYYHDDEGAPRCRTSLAVEDDLLGRELVRRGDLTEEQFAGTMGYMYL